MWDCNCLELHSKGLNLRCNAWAVRSGNGLLFVCRLQLRVQLLAAWAYRIDRNELLNISVVVKRLVDHEHHAEVLPLLRTGDTLRRLHIRHQSKH